MFVWLEIFTETEISKKLPMFTDPGCVKSEEGWNPEGIKLR